MAEVSRVLEMIGYAMSLLVLIFALGTFCYFRSEILRIAIFCLFAFMVLWSFLTISRLNLNHEGFWISIHAQKLSELKFINMQSILQTYTQAFAILNFLQKKHRKRRRKNKTEKSFRPIVSATDDTFYSFIKIA